jgi:hypothetical protein
VEEALSSFLGVSLFNPEHVDIDHMKFHAKGELALALSLKEDKDPIWAVFWALNQLRNKIAHNVESKVVEERMKFLRKTYIGTLSPNEAAEAEKTSDTQIVEDASVLAMGFLGQLSLDARGRRGIIDEHWKSRSG